MTTKRWQDWMDLVLGLWLFVSPWVLGFATGNVNRPGFSGELRV